MKFQLVILLIVLGLFIPANTAEGFAEFAVERDVLYCSHQNFPLKMDIYLPRSTDSARPAVLYIHGGGWYSGDKADIDVQEDIIELLKRGFVVVSANYRLAPRYKFPAQIIDLKCAVCYLRTNATLYGIDPSSIGVMGDSAGGHLASLLGLTGENCGFKDCGFNDGCPCLTHSTEVQAVVDLYGPTDLALRAQTEKSLLLEHVFNASDPDSDILKQASPTSYISDKAPPFLIIHGENDDQVLLNQSEEFYNLLVSENDKVSFIKVENAGHGLVQTGGPLNPVRADITESIADFFDLYLK